MQTGVALFWSAFPRATLARAWRGFMVRAPLQNVISGLAKRQGLNGYIKSCAESRGRKAVRCLVFSTCLSCRDRFEVRTRLLSKLENQGSSFSYPKAQEGHSMASADAPATRLDPDRCLAFDAERYLRAGVAS